MKPSAGEHGRHMRGFVDVGVCPLTPALSPVSGGEGGDLFGVALLDHAETAELALGAVEVAVMVGVAGDEAILADGIKGLDALDHVHRERQPGDPRLSG